jgi:hypothetical protein
MRTTIRLNDDLLTAAKEMAVRSGKSLTRVIEDALRAQLSHQANQATREPVRLTTFGGRGVHAGVDLDDSASLLDRMEADAAV